MSKRASGSLGSTPSGILGEHSSLALQKRGLNSGSSFGFGAGPLEGLETVYVTAEGIPFLNTVWWFNDVLAAEQVLLTTRMMNAIRTSKLTYNG